MLLCCLFGFLGDLFLEEPPTATSVNAVVTVVAVAAVVLGNSRSKSGNTSILEI